MSKVVAELSLSGIKKLFKQARDLTNNAIEINGENKTIEFPETAFFFPAIKILYNYDIKILGDIPVFLDRIESYIPKNISENYIEDILEIGKFTLFIEEIIMGLKYLSGEEPQNGCSGFISDTILRTLGVQLVDGRMPGVAVVLGAARDSKSAVEIIREFQKRNILTIVGGSSNDKSIIDQLIEEKVEMGLETYIVPIGKNTGNIIYPLNWALRAASIFGGIKPGQENAALRYCKERILAFGLVLGPVDDIKVASGAAAITMGFPIIADTDIPEIKPVLVKELDYKKLVQASIDLRGLKIKVKDLSIPVPFSAAFEGERIRKEQTYVQFGGKYSNSFELVRMVPLNQIEDGKVEIIGDDIDKISKDVNDPSLPVSMPLGIIVEVGGKKMQKDYESILERQIHHFLNFAMGIFHMGQRDQNWIRISKDAFLSGFRLKHFGIILHAKFLDTYPELVDKVQIKIITEQSKIDEYIKYARNIYTERDERISGMTDESVDTFYSCTLCQSYAPNHVCVITPQKLGLCGAYNWLDGKVAYEINPKGMNQPIIKGEIVDVLRGEWKGVNDFVYKWSNKTVERFFNYALMEYPTTACGCFECIVAVVPECNGVMIVNRGYSGMTPVGMSFSTLASTIGGGAQMPGFLGIGKLYIVSKKFLVPEGGLKRVIWMTKELKEFLKEKIIERCKEIGISDLLEKIADETITTDALELLEYLKKVNHPALYLPPLI